MKFVILSLPRSGSTNLSVLLNTHREIRCLSEPFSAQNYDGVYHRAASDGASLDTTLDLIWDRWNGIKHVWDSSGYPFRARPQLNVQLINSPGVKVLFLKRRNLLRRWISNYISIQTRYWFGSKAQFQETLRDFKLKPMKPQAVNRQIATDLEMLAGWTKVLARRRRDEVMPIYYEDLYREGVTAEERLERINGILSFLEFAPINREIYTKQWHRMLEPHNRWASADVYRRIPGIDRIEAECGCDETGWLFH